VSGSAAQLAASPTLTLGATVQGMILGTAAYMAPEQAKGFRVDRRADIWAFGVVLFEMLAGGSLFVGDSVPDTLARVLQREIDFDALPAGTPPAIRRLLRRCLERQPKNRLHSVADARIVIDEVLSGRVDETPAGAEIVLPAQPPRRRFAVAAAAILASAAIGFALATLRSPSTEAGAAAERRFVIPAANRSLGDRQAISPDGERIAYTADGALWLRSLGEIEPRRIAGGDGAGDPFWSPDGREIGFGREDALWRLDVVGGVAKRICDLPAGLLDGGTWTENGTVVFAVATGGWSGSLFECQVAGGKARTLLAPDRVGLRLRRPQALPGRDGVLFTVTDQSTAGEVRVLKGGLVRTLFRSPEAVRAAVLAPGRRLYFAQSSGLSQDLWFTRLGASGDEPAGEPVLLAEHGSAPSVGRRGELLFALVESAQRRVTLVDRDGTTTPVGEPMHGAALNDVLQISPDGTRATIYLPDSRQDDASQLWVVDLEGGSRQRLPNEFPQSTAAWSPDGRWLFVAGEEKGSMILPMTGGGATTKLAPGHAPFQPRWAPDGEWIVYYTITAESGRDLFRVAADGASPPEPLLREPGQQANPDVSPDGRFLAYQSDESGRPEIYVRPYPQGERKWQVTSGGGASPIWNRQGGELVWLAGDAIWSAPVRTVDGGFEAGAPRLLLRGETIGADLSTGAIYYNRMYDLSGDGRRFLIARRLGPGRNEILYVENPGGGRSR
jgi:Tol biopolymer transport system component